MQDSKCHYVEGFAIGKGELCFGHAWVTLDGIHAIDVTLQDDRAFHY